MPNQPGQAVAAFLFLLVAALLAVGVQAMVTHGIRKVSAWTCMAFALLLFLIGWNWSTWSLALSPKLASSVESLATNAWTWFGVILLVLGYAMAANIVRTIKDKNTIDRETKVLYGALKAFVLSRNLEPRQKQIIADHLSSVEPHEITLEVLAGDHEAESFMSDIRHAIDQGGWTVKETKFLEKASQGLSVHYQRPPMNAQDAAGRAKRPLPEAVLQEAFRRADVSMDGGSSGGGGVSTTKETVSLRVGPRRRDAGMLRLLR